MPYNANIPQATDQLSQSQPQILANFQALQTLIDVNHVDFTSPDQGKHASISFPVQVLPLATPILVGEVGLYNSLSALTGNNELFITDSFGNTTTLTGSLSNANGWAYLPSGLLLKWGTNQACNGNTAINFPVAGTIPVYGTVLTAFITTNQAGAGDTNQFVRLTSFNTTSVTVYGSARTTVGAAACNFNYLILGF